MSHLEDRLDASYAEAWKPDPGEKLIGTVVAIDQREDAYEGGLYPVVTIRADAGGELAWHAFHAVAKAELAKARPALGERIGVKYGGKHADKGYALWRVVVDRHESGPDWDSIGAQAEHEIAADEFRKAKATGGDDDLPF